MHKDANEKFETFLDTGDDDKPRGMQLLGTGKVSNHKMLAPAALHRVHHLVRVAVEVRQAGFPTAKP
jgi:hypothetical protein